MFKFLENIKLALRSIWSKKVRSLLTMLGVIIGVFAIVLLIGIGEGVKSQVTSQVEGLGSNLLFALPGTFDQQGSPGGFGGASTLTEKDVESIKKISGIKAVVPITLVSYPVATEAPSVPNGNINAAATAPKTSSPSKAMAPSGQMLTFGTTDQIEQVFTGQISSGQSYGRMFTPQEYQERARVAVIFSGVKDKLFPHDSNESVIGKSIFIGKEEFKIIGLKQAQESGSLFGGGEFSSLILIPFSTASAITKANEIFRIGISVTDSQKIDQLKEQIKATLLINHEGVKDFSVMTQADLLSMLNKIFDVLKTMLGGIAAISLLVGGIGVMNIMLVSVTERTKEIGLRKAIGASAFDILIQFLVEAILLTFLGGAIGIGLALAGKTIMDVNFGFAPVIRLSSVGMAFGFTVLIGVFFGVAPAIRAARLNPIDALKYE